ncbi:MAG: DUF542 domain-containing protein [Bacteroidota bacterium]
MHNLKFNKNENNLNKKVADLVTENINTAHVFKKHGIDFCCGGGISIEAVCEKNKLMLKS